jgi:hypothetical protein
VDTVRARSQAAADRLEGKAAKATGYWGAGKSILTGASKVGWTPGKGGVGIED